MFAIKKVGIFYYGNLMTVNCMYLTVGWVLILVRHVQKWPPSFRS